MARVRRGKRLRGCYGHIVTYDVNSADHRQTDRVRWFVLGRTVQVNGKTYNYPGFVELDGVRYLGQSVLFVRADRLRALRGFLRTSGVSFDVSEAWIR